MLSSKNPEEWPPIQGTSKIKTTTETLGARCPRWGRQWQRRRAPAVTIAAALTNFFSPILKYCHGSEMPEYTFFF